MAMCCVVDVDMSTVLPVLSRWFATSGSRLDSKKNVDSIDKC